MKTDAGVEIVRWQGNELTVRLPGDVDKKQMDCYIRHHRELYKRNMQENKCPFHYPLIELLLSDRYKKRTKNSQNTKLHGMIRIIANSTGNPFDVVKTEEPKAEYYDTLIERGNSTNIRNTAKELNIPTKM